MEDICRDIFHEHADSIKTKKEKIVVKNLVIIFNATLKLSNMKGFQAMSVRDLSRETGLSMGALYSYFKGKEELLDMIQNQGLRITSRILNEQIENESDARNRLRAAIRTHLFLSEVLQPWFYFAYMEAKNLSKRLQKQAIESELYTEKLFIDILDEGRRRGDFKVENSILAAALIKAVLQDWYLKRWKYSRRNIAVDEYADYIISVIERIIIE
ncbi:MAG: helix-turn-helix transcriptional regulator [Spirochaetes bacterium]|nr:helix-turn-helix transcriptional regulator [Spirochaetota bacterium]